jgi:hypothetical protein
MSAPSHSTAYLTARASGFNGLADALAKVEPWLFGTRADPTATAEEIRESMRLGLTLADYRAYVEDMEAVRHAEWAQAQARLTKDLEQQAREDTPV